MITDGPVVGTTVTGAPGKTLAIPLQVTWETLQSATMQGATVLGVSGWVDLRPAVVPVVATQDYSALMAARWDDRQVSSQAPGATLDGQRALDGTSTRYGPWVGRHLWRKSYVAGASTPLETMTQAVTMPLRFPLRGTASDEQKVPVVYITNTSAGAAPSIAVWYYFVVRMLLP